MPDPKKKKNPTKPEAKEIMQTGVDTTAQQALRNSPTASAVDLAREKELERRRKIEEAKRRVASQAEGGRR
jgi:CxxC motif-containing protein (DUF1111 family)